MQNNTIQRPVVQYLTNLSYNTSLSNWLELFLGEDYEIFLKRKKIYWIFTEYSAQETLYFCELSLPARWGRYVSD